jgi:rRNA maturation protein Nop10
MKFMRKCRKCNEYYSVMNGHECPRCGSFMTEEIEIPESMEEYRIIHRISFKEQLANERGEREKKDFENSKGFLGKVKYYYKKLRNIF